MGACCQVSSDNNYALVDDNQRLDYQENSNSLKFKANQKSFLDNDRNNSFLKDQITVYNSKDKEVPESFRSIIHDKCLIFNFNACLNEVVLPIWVKSNSKIKFSVVGEWNIIDNDNFFDCKGIANISDELKTPYGLPIGSLCCYIQGGNVFPVLPTCEIIADSTGPLVFFQNNGDFDVKPTGSLFVIVEGGIKTDINEIEEKLGWDQRIVNEIDQNNFMTNDEKMILYYLNKLRYNPALFGNLYLKHRIGKGQADEECYNYLQSLSQLPILKPNYDLYLAAKAHSQDMAEYNLTGHISSSGKTLKDRLLGIRLDINKIGENCSYGINDPLAIVLELLVDETDSKGHRKNLLDSGFDIVGICLDKHPYWNVSCVQDFSKSI